MAVADRHGLPVAVSVESATPHEVKLAIPTLVQMVIPDAPQNLIGDNAYASDKLDVELRGYGIEVIAPHRCNRKNKTQDRRRLRRYRRRWLFPSQAALKSAPALHTDHPDARLGSLMYTVRMKRTNLVLDPELLDRATRLLGVKTYSAAVNLALAEVLRLRKIQSLPQFFGHGLWQGDLQEMREDRVQGRRHGESRPRGRR